MGRTCAFLTSWLNKETEDGVRIGDWCVADPSDKTKAKCLSCPAGLQPFGKTFSVKEGFTALVKHALTAKHKTHFRPGEGNNNDGDGFEQIDMGTALRNQEEANNRKNTENRQLLEGQILFSNFVHSHSLPSSAFSCFGDLAARIFPDSNIARRWSGTKDGMRKTKGDYFLTHGVYDYHHQNLINILKSTFFSINIDESSVNRKSLLDVNVSFIDKEKKEPCKRNFTTISMEKGTTASEIVDSIVQEFDASFIPLENIVTIVTDGCSSMLGEEGGVHALLRQRLPHLPHWGGCSCHDCSNILKAGVAKLNPNLTNLFSQLHTYLSTSSLHRMREYEDFCLSQGQQPHRIPDFLDVRFRTITNCAQWMEKDDRCLYLWFEKLQKEIRTGTHKDITSAEQFILKELCSNYTSVRLDNKLILDVSDPILTCINHFECEEPKIYERFDVLGDFLVTFMAKFLINGGNFRGTETTTRDLLDIDVNDNSLQLSNENIYLGPKVEAFIEEMGLSRSSPELAPWLEKVRAFYCEALGKVQKYFRNPLTSKVLRACDILDHKVFFSTPLDDVKYKFKNIASRFSNVVKNEELPELLDQVACLHSKTKVKETAASLTPVQFFSRLTSFKEGQFSLVGRLGCALLSVHNSGSNAERDFSLLVGLFVSILVCFVT